MNRDAFFSHDKAHLDCCRKSVSVVSFWNQTSQTQLKRVVILDAQQWSKTLHTLDYLSTGVSGFLFWLENIFAHCFIDIFHLSNEEGQWGISDFQNLNLAMCLQHMRMLQQQEMNHIEIV